MRLLTSLDFVTVDVDKHRLIVYSEKPLEVLSSAVHNGGFTKVNKIVSIHVPEHNEENCNRNEEDLDKELHENPENILQRALMKLDSDTDNVVGIMTHADVRNVEISNQHNQDITVCALVTAGVEVAATAGELTISKLNSLKIDTVGTINVILLVDGNLTQSCMVDAVKTIVEAKTVALRELDIRSCFSGDLASGTVTDSVVVACSNRGKPLKYAGTATVLGELVGKAVKEALKKTLYNEQKIVPTRSLAKRLEERRISLKKAISVFLEAHPNIAEKFEQFNDELRQALSDPKLAPIIIAGLRIDDDIKTGLIPNDVLNHSLILKTFQNALISSLDNKMSENLEFDDGPLTVVENLGPFVRIILVALMNNIYLNLCNKNLQ